MSHLRYFLLRLKYNGAVSMGNKQIAEDLRNQLKMEEIHQRVMAYRQQFFLNK
ncbi:MAG: hypothetical protein U0T73_12630 [Chitinophagales bacterium]